MRRLLALLALCAACSKTAPSPPPTVHRPAAPEAVAEIEPNDFQHAQQVPSQAVITGSLSAPKDDDWYRVAGERLALRIELRKVSDASLEVYDRDRNRVLRVHAGGEDPGVIPAVSCVEACFVRVSGMGPQDYELAIEDGVSRPGQELEPNDRAVDANELQPGTPTQGTYLAGDDADWYRLAIASGSNDVLRVEVSPVPGVQPVLEVRSLADAALLATFRGTDGLYVRDLSLRLGETADAGVANPDAGLAQVGYYLVLKGRSRRGAPLSPYTILAVVEAGAPDLEAEPNDDPQHATPIRENAVGYLAPAGDQDWFRIHADIPSVLHAELSGADRADLELAVHGPGPEKPPLLARVNEAGPRETEILPAVGVPAGDSYVLVQSAPRQLDGKWVRDAEDRQNPYRLAIQLVADDGSVEREPNNDVKSAQTLMLPAAVKGTIWPRKDVDFFRFHVDAGHAAVSVLLSAVRGVDLQLRLHQLHGDGPSEVIGSSDSARGEGEEKLVSVPLKAGDYAVEVSSPRNKDASATQPYTLRIQ